MISIEVFALEPKERASVLFRDGKFLETENIPLHSGRLVDINFDSNFLYVFYLQSTLSVDKLQRFKNFCSKGAFDLREILQECVFENMHPFLAF